MRGPRARISRNWASIHGQLDAGVGFDKILTDAEAHGDFDSVRALRAEIGGYGMAKAGASKGAQLQAAEWRAAAEHAADQVLARIGRGDERIAAEIRLAVATEAETARAVLGPIGKAAASGSMSPQDRMSLGYAGAVA
jgi:hypothetical protein